MNKIQQYTPPVRKLLRHLIVLYDEIEVLSLTDKNRDDHQDIQTCIRVLERRAEEIRTLLTNNKDM